MPPKRRRPRKAKKESDNEDRSSGRNSVATSEAGRSPHSQASEGSEWPPDAADRPASQSPPPDGGSGSPPHQNAAPTIQQGEFPQDGRAGTPSFPSTAPPTLQPGGEPAAGSDGIPPAPDDTTAAAMIGGQDDHQRANISEGSTHQQPLTADIPEEDAQSHHSNSIEDLMGIFGGHQRAGDRRDDHSTPKSGTSSQHDRPHSPQPGTSRVYNGHQAAPPYVNQGQDSKGAGQTRQMQNCDKRPMQPRAASSHDGPYMTQSATSRHLNGQNTNQQGTSHHYDGPFQPRFNPIGGQTQQSSTSRGAFQPVTTPPAPSRSQEPAARPFIYPDVFGVNTHRQQDERPVETSSVQPAVTEERHYTPVERVSKGPNTKNRSNPLKDVMSRQEVEAYVKDLITQQSLLNTISKFEATHTTPNGPSNAAGSYPRREPTNQQGQGPQQMRRDYDPYPQSSYGSEIPHKFSTGRAESYPQPNKYPDAPAYPCPGPANPSKAEPSKLKSKKKPHKDEPSSDGSSSDEERKPRRGRRGQQNGGGKRRRKPQFSSSSSDEDAEDDDTTSSRSSRSYYKTAKLPPYTGKETWKVWYNRFKDVAKRKGWTEDERLDELLPRLQGPAGEFVFEQLSKRTRSNYKKLVAELQSRFQKVETAKAFGGMFRRRDQKAGETPEEYAAELKRLYDKAHPQRDSETRKEDLLHKFLDGLMDEKAKFHVEYVKEPEDIDEAVYEVVNFSNFDGKNKRPTRAVRESETSDDGENDEDHQSEDEDDPERAARVPWRNDGKNFSKPYYRHNQNGYQSRSSYQSRSNYQSNSGGQGKVDQKAEIAKLREEMMKMNIEMLKKIEQLGGASNASNENSNSSMNVTCYKCGTLGHYQRSCPLNDASSSQQAAKSPPVGEISQVQTN